MTPLLILLAVAFAWSMGAHYTGACMGMPRALGVLSARSALLLMAPLCLLGATFASHAAQGTVAHGLTTGDLGTGSEVVVVAVAFTLTTLYNWARVPTSTIQILIFSLLGTALGVGVGVHWQVVGLLAGVWLLAPLVAACLGFGFTRLLDMVPHLLMAS
ncbi:MAG: inorganic phosphate transporter, partial [Candidatus Dormibacteria bacterium]